MAAVSMAVAKRVAARRGAWICFADECGQTLRAHKATTWAARGVTPIVKVTAKGGVRVSVAGRCCYQPGQPSRLIYRTLLYRGRKGELKGFREPDLIRSDSNPCGLRLGSAGWLTPDSPTDFDLDIWTQTSARLPGLRSTATPRLFEM